MSGVILGVNAQVGLHRHLRGRGRVCTWSRDDLLARPHKGSPHKYCLQLACSSPKSSSSHVDNIVDFEGDHYIKHMEELKGVGKTLRSNLDRISIMTLIDTLQRLGIAYHFEDDINVLMDRCCGSKGDEVDLFGTALQFRLLRQRSHNISPDVFHKFMDKKGEFKEVLSKDLWGLLSLHEASYMGAKGEEVLSQAMEFSREHLEKSMLSLEPSLSRDVGLALLLPRQRRMERSEARRYIESSGKGCGRSLITNKRSPIYFRPDEECGRNLNLLKLAAMDFNMVQSLYQNEMADVVRWWRELGLAENLKFARDRPVEGFLWTVGMFPEPCFSTCRIEVAKVVAILLVIDDMYDSYGSLDDLVLFTSAIQRWDIGAMEHLPQYMKICYMALYNTINDIGYTVLKQHGWCIIPHLKKTWQDMCEAFLIEARWFNSDFVPTVEDYLNNGVTTAGTYMALVHGFFLMGEHVGKERVGFIDTCPKLFSSAGRILRLWDDLGTARDEQQRGDVASSIECYMKENGNSSEHDARMHVRQLINISWEDLNGESLAPAPLPHSIIRASKNLARTAQFVYEHGDDVNAPSVEDHVQSLLIKPIFFEGFSSA